MFLEYMEPDSLLEEVRQVFNMSVTWTVTRATRTGHSVLRGPVCFPVEPHQISLYDIINACYIG